MVYSDVWEPLSERQLGLSSLLIVLESFSNGCFIILTFLCLILETALLSKHICYFFLSIISCQAAKIITVHSQHFRYLALQHEYSDFCLFCIITNASLLLKLNLVSNLMLVTLPLFPFHVGISPFLNPRSAQHLHRCCLSVVPYVAGFPKISVEWCSWCLMVSPGKWASLIILR